MDRTADPTNGRTTDPTTLGSNLTAGLTDGPSAATTTVTVAEAAELLGISAEAARMRVKRGTLASTKIAGTVYVLLDRGTSGPNVRPNDEPNVQPNAGPNDRTNAEAVTRLEAHNGTLRDQVDHLRRELEVRNEELRRKDHLLAAALERVPAIDAPLETPDGSVSSAPGSPAVGDPRASATTQEATSRRSWWRRFFGL